MPRIVLAGLLLAVGLLIAGVASRLKPMRVIDESMIVGKPKVKLAVLVVFDQMRGDYLVNKSEPTIGYTGKDWKTHFPPGGFRRLMDDGCWFSQCYYPYATTTTGPGHASMLTGTTIAHHGIIDNDWYDRAVGTQVNCANCPRYESINLGTKGRMIATSSTTNSNSNSAPDRLLSPTVGDNLKASGRGGKVIGLSIKDRAAIFPSGHRADAAYWFGRDFVTSSYYMDVLPPWVRQFNATDPADRWYGQSWNRSRPDLDYVALAGRDDGGDEALRVGLGTTFPHPLTGGKPTITKDYYDALIFSPFGNELLLEFAKRCIEAEQLGRDDAPDLLTISFSSNDLVGHLFGPDSQEVLDVTLRSDRIVAELLNYLDAHVGKDEYVLVVSADHGICPLPSEARLRGLPGAYADSALLNSRIEKFLEALHGRAIGPQPLVAERDLKKGQANRWLESSAAPWFYLNYRQIEARKLDRDTVTESVAAHLRTLPEYARIYTARQIEAMTDGDTIDSLVKASYFPDRSGDLYVIPNEYSYFWDAKNRGTSHGSPYEYDRLVPLIVFGPGTPKGQQTEPVVPQQAAAIIADYLGVKPPRDALWGMPKVFDR